jgi:signal transduction histidine kinase
VRTAACAPGAAPRARRILLVDDNPVQRKLGRLRLGDAGFVVDTAAGADDALRAARRAPPDAIMSDILMGDLDGFTLCRMLREEPSLRDVPIVLFSAHFDEHADRELAAAVGASAIIGRTPDFEGELAALWHSLQTQRSSAAEPQSSVLVARRMARHLQETMAKVEAGEAARRELEAFSYSVAHDLRAPLRRIDGFTAAILEDCSELVDDQVAEHLERVRASVLEMGELIEGLLSLSRVTRSEIHLQDVDLSALARRTLQHLRGSAPSRRVDVVIPDGLIVRGDRALLEILLVNLLGNAWKFTSRTDGARIEVGCSEQTGQRVYFVADNGAGFDMAYAAKLFHVFQRLHTVQDFDGTGIGLATAHRVVSRHGGSIWANAELDAGATFYFTLGTAELTSGDR